MNLHEKRSIMTPPFAELLYISDIVNIPEIIKAIQYLFTSQFNDLFGS